MTDAAAPPPDAAAQAAFIRAQTAIDRPPLVPELRLHLATRITPLWQATQDVLDGADLPPPYWAFPWAGGQAMTRWLLDHPQAVAGRSVLDFAAGCGMGAIACAQLGAARVEAAEIDPVARAAIALNATLNDAAAIGIREDDVLTVDPDAERWEVILAGDVCYEKPMADRVLPWLRAHAAAGALVLLADPGRAYLPRAGLERLAMYTVPTTRELEDREERVTGVYRVLPQESAAA